MENNNSKEPSIPFLILRILLPGGDLNQIYTNFKLYYEDKVKEHGSKFAWFCILGQIIKSSPALIYSNIFDGMIMLKNYIKIAFRSLLKNKLYSIINVTGLAIGLSCIMMIYLYIQDEYSFDNFHEKKDDIFRVIRINNSEQGGIRSKDAWLPYPTGGVLKDFFPEVEESIRFDNAKGIIRYKEKMFEEQITFTDKGFFNVFSFNLIYGSEVEILTKPDNVVLTKSIAVKYFGNENPVGENIKLAISSMDKIFTVRGVVEDPPGNSTIDFDILIPFDNINDTYGKDTAEWWGTFAVANYVLLNNKSILNDTQSRFIPFVDQYFQEINQLLKDYGMWNGEGNPFTFDLQNISDVHLNTNIANAKGDPGNSLILSGIALIVIIIASFNFMSMSIGKSGDKFVEVGIKKIIGAKKDQLFFQFLFESLILTLISLLIGVFLTAILLPEFNEFAQKNLTISTFFSPINIALILLLVLFIIYYTFFVNLL